MLSTTVGTQLEAGGARMDGGGLPTSSRMVDMWLDGAGRERGIARGGEPTVSGSVGAYAELGGGRMLRGGDPTVSASVGSQLDWRLVGARPVTREGMELAVA